MHINKCSKGEIKVPNHVRTVIRFKNLKEKDDFECLTRMLARPLEEKDDMFTPDHEDWIIDFNKIIPEPQTIEECPKYAIIGERSRVEVDDDRHWFDWYNWRIKNWGTKWGAYDGYCIQDTTTFTFVFSTAWSVATPIIDKLPLLGFDFEVLYANEDLGANCGKLWYNAKTKEWIRIDEETMGNARDFARRVWDKY